MTLSSSTDTNVAYSTDELILMEPNTKPANLQSDRKNHSAVNSLPILCKKYFIALAFTMKASSAW